MYQAAILDAEFSLPLGAHMEESEGRFLYPWSEQELCKCPIDSERVQCSLSWKTETEAASKLLQAFNCTNIPWKVLKVL